tara:strand:+ start:23 stop:721 length:699 start_codon:yes stop_codon:yes gene_type:complete
MKDITDWIAIVPARIGSKRLRKKNLLKIGNLSLVEICVKKAIESNMFSEVVISSDSNEIISKAKSQGAISFGIRKNELSGDEVSSADVIQDLLSNERLNKIKGFTLLQCTSPFTEISTIKDVTKKSCSYKTSCLSIREIEHTFLEWLITTKGDKVNKVNQTKGVENIRSQDCTKVYAPSGNVYSATKSYFKKYKSFLGPDSYFYKIDNKCELVDIDNLEDYELALNLYNNKI